MEKSYPMDFRHLCVETELHLLAHTNQYADGINVKTKMLVKEEIEAIKQRLSILTKKKTGRCLQKHAAPLREALLVHNSNFGMKHIKILCRRLESRFGINMVQIHLHLHPLDDTQTISNHAHIIFNWMDESTGKSIKLNKLDTIELQTMVRNHLEQLQRVKPYYNVKNKIQLWDLKRTLFNSTNLRNAN